MKLFLTSDSDWEAKISRITNLLYDTGYTHFFEEQYYGSSLDCVAIVLMCQDPSLNLKQRIRLSKKERTIYMDIMLDLNQFLKIEQKEREKIVVEKLINEVPAIIRKYRLEDFDIIKFESDLKNWMIKIL
ncbi:hypothetical protein ABE545_23115 [Sphingobacterium faecium]|uniref:hypothetical protein n=1 Tax=Sphingobacterium faecium TaxID=34087 RepID=UPI003208184E